MMEFFTALRRRARLGGLLVLLSLLALFLGGCFGSEAPDLSPTAMQKVGDELTAIERQFTDVDALTVGELNTLTTTLGFGEKALASQNKATKAHAHFLKGYANEVQEHYSEAATAYREAVRGNTSFMPLANFRLGVLGARELLGPRSESIKIAKTSLGTLRMSYGKSILIRAPELAREGGVAIYVAPPKDQTLTGPAFVVREAASIATARLDPVYQHGGGLDGTYYQLVHAFMGYFKQISPAYGAAIALFLLSLLVKVITAPLTTVTYRNMRDMQRLQPLLKEVQEKYKDDRARLAEEQMKLMKEHKVSPAGGCLPMLIQMPIFIAVYQAVLVYAAGFNDSSFLWVANLAHPDLPLLALYAASMVVTQLLTATPTTDPQQKLMQQQMTVLMPLMFVALFLKFASAFVLYWFFLNVLSSAHQYYLMRKFKQEDAALALPTPANPSAPPHRKKGK
jgi:YidC/Oxa1 family membrane protein insertase